MNITKTKLDGVLIVEGDIYRDDRGYFLELWRGDRYTESGIGDGFVQDNVSFSRQHVLRGLHYQYPRAQAKLVTVLSGKIFDVAVDIRRNSQTFGQWIGVELSSDSKKQLYVPRDYAHGFCVISEHALVLYKCDEFYSVADENAILWSDPALGIEWPTQHPLVSDKDSRAPYLSDIPPDSLPSVRT